LDFVTTEEKFYALMGRLAAGVITQNEFKTRLEELVVRDDQGRTWMIGAQSGKWYCYDGKRWVQDTPPETGRVSPTDETMVAIPPAPVSETDIQPPSEERCPRCDHALIAGATFCDRCGLRLPGDTVMYSTEDMAGLETEPCPKCGRPLPVSASFCAGCGYRRSERAAPPPPPPVAAREPFAVPPPAPPPPAITAAPSDRQPWLNSIVIALVGLVILCCLVTAALALFWPDSPVSLMNLLGGPAGPTVAPEFTQTPTYVTPTFTPGSSPTAIPSPEPGGPTATATEPPPTRVRTPTATTAPTTPPPLPPTATRAPIVPTASPTEIGLHFRVKETRLIEEKWGLGFIHVFVLDKNGQGIPGIKVRIDGGDPTSWKLEVTTDSRGLAEFNALSSSKYNITLVDYDITAPWIDRTNKSWEVIFEAY